MSLERFVSEQDQVYSDVLSELRAGRKLTHWMWFIFPQIAGLGRSPTAQFFAIADLDEARRYLAHPILGARLCECAGLVLAIDGRTPLEIFGSPDDMKLRSCMTLFEMVDETRPSIFGRILDKFYAGERDGATQRLAKQVCQTP